MNILFIKAMQCVYYIYTLIVDFINHYFRPAKHLRCDSYVDMLTSELGDDITDELISRISNCDNMPYDIFGDNDTTIICMINNCNCNHNHNIRKRKRKIRPRIRTIPKNNIRIYIDHSNMAYGIAYDERLDVEQLHNIIMQKRYVSAAYIAGSFPDDNSYWNRWSNLGYSIKRMSIGKEECVDESLHGIICNDFFSNAKDNYTAVILTGDGNNNDGWSTFPRTISGLLNNGIKVELWCWQDRTNGIYKSSMFSDLRIIELDQYREKVIE